MDALWIILSSCAEEKGKLLLPRIRSGDPQALAELYDVYSRMLFVMILRIVNDRATTEDLLQETFLRVWNRASQWKEEYGLVGPWLIRIARNCALDYRKSSQSHFFNAAQADETEFPSITIEGDILAADRVQHLRGALNGLSEIHRQVLELAYYEGLSQTEIAQRLKQPLGTIKGWTRAALQKMRATVDYSLVH